MTTDAAPAAHPAPPVPAPVQQPQQPTPPLQPLQQQPLQMAGPVPSAPPLPTGPSLAPYPTITLPTPQGSVAMPGGVAYQVLPHASQSGYPSLSFPGLQQPSAQLGPGLYGAPMGSVQGSLAVGVGYGGLASPGSQPSPARQTRGSSSPSQLPSPTHIVQVPGPELQQSMQALVRNAAARHFLGQQPPPPPAARVPSPVRLDDALLSPRLVRSHLEHMAQTRPLYTDSVDPAYGGSVTAAPGAWQQIAGSLPAAPIAPGAPAGPRLPPSHLVTPDPYATMDPTIAPTLYPARVSHHDIDYGAAPYGGYPTRPGSLVRGGSMSVHVAPSAPPQPLLPTAWAAPGQALMTEMPGPVVPPIGPQGDVRPVYRSSDAGLPGSAQYGGQSRGQDSRAWGM